MSPSIRWVAQMVTFATFITVAHASTAFVSICCNAPSTAGVFNPTTLAQMRTIVTGSGGDSFVLSPNGAKMFVTVDNKQELQVIATATGTILATVPTPVGVSGTVPLNVVISPDGSRVFVFAPQARPSALIYTIDTVTYLSTQTPVPAANTLGPPMISPDGSQLYFEVGYANCYIQVLNSVSLQPVKQIPVSGIPTALAATPSGLILMTNTSNQLQVIDPGTSNVNTFSLPNLNQGTPGNVISSPDSTTAYVSFATGAIAAVSVSTGATVFDVTVNYVPTHFAISPDGSTLYSTNRSPAGAWSLSEFNIPAQKVVKTIGQLGPLWALALGKDGLYVLDADESAIATVDVASRKATRVALGGVGVNSVAIPPNRQIVWASTYGFGIGGDILFLNPATNRLAYKVGPSGSLTFSPDGKVVYVANPGVVTAYDTTTLAPIGSAYVGQLTNVDQAIPSPDGKRLYISATFVSGAVNNQSVFLSPGEILVLDTSTFKYTASISVADGMGAMTLTPDGSTLIYTANFGRVHLLDTATNKVTGTIHLTPANGVLSSIALSPDALTAYVVDGQNNLLLVVNLTSQTQLAAIAVGQGPSPVVVRPDGSEVWVATLAGLEVVNAATFEISGTVQLPGAPSAIVFAP